MSFWRVNDVIITLCVRWEYVLLSFKFTVSLGFFSQTGTPLDCSGIPLNTGSDPYWEEHQLLTASSSVACGWTVWLAGLLTAIRCGHWVTRRRAGCSSKSKRIENSHWSVQIEIKNVPNTPRILLRFGVDRVKWNISSILKVIVD